MNKVIQIVHYNGNQAQNLRNIPILLPSIIAVQQGEKQLQWQGRWLRFHSKNWLLVAPHTRLTFVNNPHQSQFHSVQISFLITPSEELLSLSKQNETTITPELIADQEGHYLWQTLLNFPEYVTPEIQQHVVQGLFHYLALRGQLHTLFAADNITWSEKLSQYFRQDPSHPYSIEQTCHHFGLSKATLIRRLHGESTNFRDVLAQVRMGHAISLMQEKSFTQLELAQLCGYQSEVRFAQRFQKQFGLSPKQYQKTVH